MIRELIHSTIAAALASVVAIQGAQAQECTKEAQRQPDDVLCIDCEEPENGSKTWCQEMYLGRGYKYRCTTTSRTGCQYKVFCRSNGGAPAIPEHMLPSCDVEADAGATALDSGSNATADAGSGADVKDSGIDGSSAEDGSASTTDATPASSSDPTTAAVESSGDAKGSEDEDDGGCSIPPHSGSHAPLGMGLTLAAVLMAAARRRGRFAP